MNAPEEFQTKGFWHKQLIWAVQNEGEPGKRYGGIQVWITTLEGQNIDRTQKYIQNIEVGRLNFMEGTV